ncbi:GDSL family lipase [Sorangium cellulosum]|uniref:GDSL family lipase n=1 Tax=Sorangium cellulosum TaxID=56 RepID=A0A4P2Q8I9_SORCE|nr:SGNH/GDSL hydrolase family protein [Sorangium cellulosum]AUX25516.1 GDSL family lipase [Sorangium cellulosum]
MRKTLWALLFLLIPACGDDSSDATTSSGTTGTGGATTTSGTAGGGGTSDGGGGSSSGEGGADGTGGNQGGADGTGGTDVSSGTAGGGGAGGEAEAHWVGTWTTGPQLTEPHNNPPEPGLTNNTLRQVVYTSIGGSSVRLLLSNEFGNGPVTMEAVHIADSTTADGIQVETDTALTFAGEPSVTIPKGETVFSDPVDYAVKPLTKLAVTIKFGAVPSEITGHPGSRTNSYLQTGNGVSSATLSSPVATAHWYYITGLDVAADPSAGAVVILGDSITDGRGSITDENTRWPDYLSRRLRANEATANVAVLNLGIGGNNVLTGGLGPTALERFDRDVLGQRGARWLIVYEGVNDIGTSSDPNVADRLIEAYETFIDKAHDKGMKAYGVPILPFNGNGYYSPEHEAARQKVNEWIRTSNQYDAVIDLDAAVRDPDDPSRLREEFLFENDWLHLNSKGYETMAGAVDLKLFTE